MSQLENAGPGPAAGPRVLVWPSCWYPNRNAPHSGIFIRRQAAAMAMFHPTAVLFVTPDPSLKTRRDIVVDTEEGLPTVRVYFRPAPPSPWASMSNTLRFMAAAAAGRRSLPPSFARPDLINVQVTPPVGLILFRALFWRRPKLVFSEHWSKYLLPPARENLLRRWFIRRFASRCAAVTAVSEALLRGMRAHGWRCPLWRVIGNPVDPEMFFPRATGRSAGDVTILHVSSQTENKNVPGILRAVAALAGGSCGLRLLVVGDGPARPANERLARELGLLDRVAFFRDPLPEGELAAAMRQGDILVLFSGFETFSCVAAEALASGLAVVSTPTAVAEYMPAASGTLVPFADEGALAAALERTADLMPAFDGSIGHRAVRERFAPGEIGKRFAGLFRETLGREAL